MADILDVFNGDAFKAVSLTEAVNRMPFQPGVLGGMNLVSGQGKGIATTTAVVEFKNGRITLVANQSRNGPRNVSTTAIRERIPVPVPHLPEGRLLEATDIQNFVSMGGNQLMNVSTFVADNQNEMRINLDATLEFHMVGMVNGIILDADGTTELVNYFTVFGQTRPTEDIATSVTGAVNTACNNIVRTITDALGGTRANSIACICGNQLFDNVRDSADVVAAHHNSEQFLRDDLIYANFLYRGIRWINYRGSVENDFVATTKGAAFPIGPGLYQRNNAPANYMATANRPGQPMSSSIARLDHDKGIDLEVQANPLFIPNRPESLVEVTDTVT